MQLHIIPKLTILIGILGLVSLIILTQSNQDIRQQAKETGTATLQTSRNFKRGVIKDRSKQILEVTLHYNVDTTPQVSVLSTTIKEGFIPIFSKRKLTSYKLLLLNKKGKVIKSAPFEINDEVQEIIPLPGDPTVDNDVQLTNFNFVVSIPWSSEGSQIQITDAYDKVISTETLGNLLVVPPTKDYVTAEPETTNDVSTSLLGKIVNTISGPPPVNYLDIVFISNGYSTQTDFDQYHQQVTAMSNYLLTYEPFKSRTELIRFSSIDNLNNLDCVQSGRLITCDLAKVFQAINTVGVPYDKVIVVDNSPLYGGSGGTIGVTYNGLYQSQVFVHEFGHVLANLEDEYVKQSVNDDPNAFIRENCYRGTPPNPAWQGLVGVDDYKLGCNYSDWYRSSENSLMRDVTAEYFNPISQREISKAIGIYTAVPEETPTPTLPPNNTVCDSDINQDGNVNLNDYSLLLGSLLKNPIPTGRADINGDGKVDLIDYSMLIRSFLQQCP